MTKFLNEFQRANNFETWFVGLLSAWDTSQSRVFTHTLRGIKREMYDEYCRLLDGGTPRETARALLFNEGDVNEYGRDSRTVKDPDKQRKA
jgi:hypothetical protein